MNPRNQPGTAVYTVRKGKTIKIPGISFEKIRANHAPQSLVTPPRVVRIARSEFRRELVAFVTQGHLTRQDITVIFGRTQSQERMLEIMQKIPQKKFAKLRHYHQYLHGVLNIENLFQAHELIASGMFAEIQKNRAAAKRSSKK